VSASGRKLKILFFGPLPPPYHGVSVADKILLESRFAEAFEVKHIATNFVTTIDDIGSVALGKFLTLIKVAWQTLAASAFKRFDYACYPIAFGRNAFLRDVLLIAIPKLFGMRVIYYTHGNNLPDFRDQSPAWLKRMIDRVIGWADGAIVVGENLQFNYANYLPPERRLAVHYGIPYFSISRPQERPAGETLTVLFFSNLLRSKGYFVVLQAIELVIRKFPAIRFVFGGEWETPEAREEAMAFVRERGLESFVDFKGRVIGPEKEKLFYAADIFVFPTFYYFETFGLVNLEAMQAGLPVIATARGAIPEIIEDGVNGYIVDEQSPEQVAGKILLLAQDDGLRRRMRAANIEKFDSHFTQEHYAGRMIRAFLQLDRVIAAEKDA